MICRVEGRSSSLTASAVILGQHTWESASRACALIGETLLEPPRTRSRFHGILGSYGALDEQSFWVHGARPTALDNSGRLARGGPHDRLPVLCTNLAPYSNITLQNSSAPWQVTVEANKEYLTGYRDHLAFRFLGIRYAAEPRRWTYSKLYRGAGERQSALNYGDFCAQANGGSEDCLFLNVWTPYLPAAPKSNTKKLKAVMVWIHGGAFTSGEGSDPTFDGSNLASRGDVVVVTINYRLGTLGFLALNDGQTNGNFGLADQVVALEWIQRNIRSFGGDPERVTIFGQSAGAASVRALLASPKATGLFSSAIMQSNLGGLGYGTTYSLYYTIAQEVDAAANSILAATDCSDVSCLRDVPVETLTKLSIQARYLVVDETYLVTKELQLNNTSGVPNVPLMLGVMRDDGAAFINYPSVNETLVKSLSAAGLPKDVASGDLFPIPNGSNHTLNVFNATARVATDGILRCVDEATAYSGVSNGVFPITYFYEFNRSYQTRGYSPNYPVCEAPVSATFPYGDPSAEYFKCHSGELYYVFGNIRRVGLPFRDSDDLAFEQFIVDTWSSFARTHNPNPDFGFLEPRGFANTIAERRRSGDWEAVLAESRSMRRLQWPSVQVPFSEIEQCAGLQVPLSFLE